MVIESYSFNKLIKSNFIPTLLTDEEVTERIISLEDKYPGNFNFVRITGSNVPPIIYTYDVNLEKLTKRQQKRNTLSRHYRNAFK
tara:strand:+ start:538 stop:792 length:255 start_codon:yes stop_codon:yes gene_type:complete